MESTSSELSELAAAPRCKESRHGPGEIRWRLADLGLSRDQIPAFADALLDRQATSEAPIAAAEVQTSQWMPGPGADALAGL